MSLEKFSGKVQSNKNDEQETAGGSGTGLYYIEIIR
jgi:hypothetical protein